MDTPPSQQAYRRWKTLRAKSQIAPNHVFFLQIFLRNRSNNYQKLTFPDSKCRRKRFLSRGVTGTPPPGLTGGGGPHHPLWKTNAHLAPRQPARGPQATQPDTPPDSPRCTLWRMAPGRGWSDLASRWSSTSRRRGWDPAEGGEMHIREPHLCRWPHTEKGPSCPHPQS